MRNNYFCVWEIIINNDLTWEFFHRHIQPSKRTDITLLIPVLETIIHILFTICNKITI